MIPSLNDDMLQYKPGIWDWVYYILLGFTTKLQAMDAGVNKPLNKAICGKLMRTP
jgi:hypothetical protein